jgi:hypothetical protein
LRSAPEVAQSAALDLVTALSAVLKN